MISGCLPSRVTETMTRLLVLFLLTATAFSEKVIYKFEKGVGDGESSYANLVATHGKLYGTTRDGGQFGEGTVFELTPPATQSGAWTETVLYSFGLTGRTDAALPQTGLVFDDQGNLYGASGSGGLRGVGTIFKLVPPTPPATLWTESVLYSFTGLSGDGFSPNALTLGRHNQIYGTTSFGGANMQGTVFTLARTKDGIWVETVLYSFTGINGDGYQPRAGLLADTAGDLYGTTSSGTCGDCSGCASCGTVFELLPPMNPGDPWTETVLYNFTGTNGDGWNPMSSLILDSMGNLYGTTEFGGTSSSNGTVFELSPPVATGATWTESVLYAFTGAGDGALPLAPLVLDSKGKLYGTTWSRGVTTPGCLGQAGCGTIFQVSPPGTPGGAWTETTLHEFGTGPFSHFDGASSESGLTFGPFGALYGTTPRNSASSGGVGSVFSIHP